MDINRYNKVAASLGSNFKQLKVSPHTPTPTDMEYKSGYIVRYFIQKANDTESKITEVDSVGYKKFTKSSFYTAVSLDWRVIGTDEQIRDSNKKSVSLAMVKIPKISLYLPNLLQFRKKDLENTNI